MRGAFQLSIVISIILTGTTAIKCFSNQFPEMQDENCGPTGFCFIMRKDKLIREGYFTVRGCDHTFLCELISETEGVEEMAFTKGIVSYCMENVQYINSSGYFCCCNENWCNNITRMEEVPKRKILQELIQGTATEEKWHKLQKMAREYDITVAKDKDFVKSSKKSKKIYLNNVQ